MPQEVAKPAAPRWGDPPWRVEPTPRDETAPEQADVVVVGAGFAGLATALRLAHAGLRVVVLEASRVGAGASGRTGGLVLEDTAAGALPGAGGCLDALARVVADESIECDLALPGCDERVHTRAAGDPGPGEWRDGDQRLVRAATVPGGTVDPGHLASGLVRAVRAAGVRVLERAPVADLASVASGWVAIAGARIACERVVVTTNARGLVPGVLARGLRPALTLALCTEPLPESLLAEAGFGPRPFYTQDQPYLWGRRTPDGRLILGAGLVAAETAAPEAQDVSTGPAAAGLTTLEARLRALHPALAAARVGWRWGGPVVFRPGGVPLLAVSPVEPRIALAGAFAGHGVALGFRLAETLAEHVLTGALLPAWGAPPEGQLPGLGGR
ncbi:MAG: FAD-binding oxidoreductase [Proteobacteria bacterium]|nr:FAD-binding oxidoreductase [Pseudomonadota bacterium]